MKNHRAFTLVELLTVIAVIGVLAAILIPVVGKVRQKGQETRGMSNLRQVAIGCLLVAEEERGLLPASWEDDATQLNFLYHVSKRVLGNTDPNPLSWVRFEALHDPSASDRDKINSNPMPDFSAHPRLMPDTVRAGPRVNVAQVKQPSQMFLVFDASVGDFGRSYYTARWIPGWEEPLGDDGDAIVVFPESDLVQGSIGWRMRGGRAAKVAFVDGHIEVVARDGVRKRNIQM